MLSWIVWNRTVIYIKNGFRVKITNKGWYAIKPNKPKPNLHLQDVWYTNKMGFFFQTNLIRLDFNRYIVDDIRCSSSSSYHTSSTDIPDLLSPSVPIAHRFRLVFNATSCIGIELLYRGSSRSILPLLVYVKGSHSSTSLMSSSLLLQQCLVCLNLIVFVMGGELFFSVNY